MRIQERDPRQRGLTTIYTPAEPRRVMPSELAEEIVLTHPAQPFGSSLDATTFEFINGALGVTQIFSAEPAPGHYFWLHNLYMTHDDPASRISAVGVHHLQSGQFHVAGSDKALGPGEFLSSPRTLLVPARHRAFALVNAIAGGSRVQLTLLHLDLLEGELPPYL